MYISYNKKYVLGNILFIAPNNMDQNYKNNKINLTFYLKN